MAFFFFMQLAWSYLWHFFLHAACMELLMAFFFFMQLAWSYLWHFFSSCSLHGATYGIFSVKHTCFSVLPAYKKAEMWRKNV